MVATRKGRTSSEGKRRQSASKEIEKEPVDNDSGPEQEPVEKAASSSSKKRSSSSKKIGGLSPREVRRSRREDLRHKETGVGVSAPTGKKIVFGDDEDLQQEEPEEAAADADPKGDAEEDSDDDSAVEEVGTSVARKKDVEQRERERATARTAVSAKPRRKRKKVEATPAVDNEFDEDFFEQLDQDMAEEKIEKPVQPQGRHTTFVSADEEEVGTTCSVGHNIELAVLQDDSKARLILNSEVSESAVVFSKGRLLSGSDGISAKQLQKAKKAGRKTAGTPSWKRSKKMNLLLAPGAKSKRQKTQGRAAAHFVVE